MNSCRRERQRLRVRRRDSEFEDSQGDAGFPSPDCDLQEINPSRSEVLARLQRNHGDAFKKFKLNVNSNENENKNTIRGACARGA